MKKCGNKTQYKSLSTIIKQENIIQVVEPIAPEAMAKKLVSFSVTVDSVVATATLIFDDSHNYLSLHWGDGQVEVINLSRLRRESPKIGGNQEPNTLTFQHVYRAPYDNGRMIIIAETKDSEGSKSFDTAVIEVDRRYKLSLYPIILTFPDHLDNVIEQASEIEARICVSQGEEVFFNESWKSDVNTNPHIMMPDEIVQWHLNQSSFSRDIKYSDAPIHITLTLTEEDVFGDSGDPIESIWEVIKEVHLFPLNVIPPLEFDGSTLINLTDMPLKIHPKTTSIGSSFATAIFDVFLEGKIYAKFNYNLDLIVPLDRSLKKVMATS